MSKTITAAQLAALQTGTVDVGSRVVVTLATSEMHGVLGTIGSKHTVEEGWPETIYAVALDNGWEAILKASEIAPAPHPLSWSCDCEACLTSRKTLGRAWSL